MALSLGRGAKDPVVEHKEMLETLRRRDADAAGHLIRIHLQMTVSELLELFHEEQSDGDVRDLPQLAATAWTFESSARGSWQASYSLLRLPSKQKDRDHEWFGGFLGLCRRPVKSL